MRRRQYLFIHYFQSLRAKSKYTKNLCTSTPKTLALQCNSPYCFPFQSASLFQLFKFKTQIHRKTNQSHNLPLNFHYLLTKTKKCFSSLPNPSQRKNLRNYLKKENNLNIPRIKYDQNRQIDHKEAHWKYWQRAPLAAVQFPHPKKMLPCLGPGFLTIPLLLFTPQ